MSEQQKLKTMERRRRRTRKLRELAALLPLAGVFLLATPVVNSFTTSRGETGQNHTLIYIFGIWALLIAGTFLLSRLLGRGTRDK